jgi:hypothetical protein
MDLGSVANVSEVNAASIFSLEVSRTIQVLIQYIQGDDDGVGYRSGAIGTEDWKI